MKKQFLSASLTAVMVIGISGTASAEDIGAGFDLSANVGLVSDYVWRGISYSDNDAAVQGGIDLKHSSGAYIGTWWSSLNAWIYDGYDYASAEQDVYVGYNMNFSKEVAMDLRYTNYIYSPADELNFDEIHVGVSAYGASAGIDYADNRSPGDASTAHYYVGYRHTFAWEIGVSALYGMYDLKDDFNVDGDSSYNYWNIGVNKTLGGIIFGLSYNDTDLSGDGCTYSIFSTISHNGDDICGAQYVISANKSF